ncbi:DNA polymerase subunit Cdc27 [Mycena rebaudengoi]|nr:DNA polymerase subunit Cdc27 [Mycena rebaudengoi]
MTTQPIRDYLTKQLLIEKNIVTYRSLSRVLALHVNVAKNELADFHANEGNTLAATYLLSGQVVKTHDEDMDMDDRDSLEEEDEWEEGEYVEQIEMVLVGERELESVQAQFTRVDSIHVYSLSPAAIRDAGLLCTPTEKVRELDNQKGAELAAIVGTVIGDNVKLSKGPLPSWGGRKAPPPVAGSSKVPAAAPVKQEIKKEEEAKPKEKPTEKPKPTGKLDFSKAKAKPLKKEEPPAKKAPAKAEPKRKVESRPPSVASTVSEKVQAKMDASKRGTKRKSALVSDSEDEEEVVAKPPKPAAKSAAAKPQQSVRVHKGVILSDDENDAPPAPANRKGKGKATAVDSDAEKDLIAMMDVDDDIVTRASRPEPETEREEESVEDVDVDMSDGDSKPKPVVKRKPKKVVPVGRNGLKKKRVVKSKTRVDEKGYMVTDDYSEYESVDEEEAPPPPKTKAKAKAAEGTDVAKSKPAAKPAPAKVAPAKSAAKPTKSSSGSSKPAPGPKGSLANFFSKPK